MKEENFLQELFSHDIYQNYREFFIHWQYHAVVQRISTVTSLSDLRKGDGRGRIPTNLQKAST